MSTEIEEKLEDLIEGTEECVRRLRVWRMPGDLAAEPILLWMQIKENAERAIHDLRHRGQDETEQEQERERWASTTLGAPIVHVPATEDPRVVAARVEALRTLVEFRGRLMPASPIWVEVEKALIRIIEEL